MEGVTAENFHTSLPAYISFDHHHITHNLQMTTVHITLNDAPRAEGVELEFFFISLPGHIAFSLATPTRFSPECQGRDCQEARSPSVSTLSENQIFD